MSTISEYEITEELYESSNSLVFRGHREADNQPVILKMLRQTYPLPEKIAWFKREYEITRNLDLAGVVDAYSLETDQQRRVMALEDFGGESLARLGLAGKLTLTEFLPLATQLSDILGQLHQRRIIHKDINPSNIVLNPATGQVKLIDFGISSVLTRENPTFRNPNVLEGTLAYISPEQTGRMNRAMDYRTDFYSLGVTFYELLTGQLPFLTLDAIELVHAHIAKQPIPPHVLKSDIPQSLSEIVLKLMAKNAEDRYQSAYGLKADLAECLRQWQTTGRIDSFILGQHDISDRFQIPQKLYGREREIEILLTAFERVAGTNGSKETEDQRNRPRPEQSRRIELMLVSGHPGIGKSALIQEIYKPITGQRGYFIAGKFDQLQRNVPYTSLAQAFRTLMRQLLTESEAEIATWREKLLAALSPNGQVIIEMVPEAELIIGPQPAVPDLPPLEAQNRFNLVFQNFIHVFTRPEHPLALFLDDLQWADAASLQLLKLLMTAPDTQYLFLIGAYRNNEVSPIHPLMLALDEVRQAGGVVNQIALTPLKLSHITQFIADTLYCAPEIAKPLAELVLAKTNGNPFFIIEFLKALYAEELLMFAFTPPNKEGVGERRGWQWDVGQIQARGMTDNVVELMAGNVQKLDGKTQQVLRLAACIGNQFDLPTLALVYQKSPRETAIDLWEALITGMVLPLGDAYKLMGLEVPGLAETVRVEYQFAHDRIQQAAYSLIPEADRQAVHRQVGQLLLQNTPTHEQEQRIFDIVNHLNLARQLMEQQSEQDKLAELNLLAGRKAKASAAYQPAFDYFQIGLALLSSPTGEGPPAAGWQRRYDLTLALHEETAEATYLNAAFEQTEQLVAETLQQVRTSLDKVKVYEIQVSAYTAQNKLVKAIETGLQALKLFDVVFPDQPGPADIMLALQETQLDWAGRPIESLSALPEMTDPTKLAAIRILKTISAVSYLAAPLLFPLVVCKQVSLSIKYGNTAESAFAYVLYGICLCGIVGDIESGYRFGKLGESVLEQLHASELKGKVVWTFNFFVKLWKEHLKETFAPALEAYQSALETGDIEFAAYSLYLQPTFSYHIGQELTRLNQEMALVSETMGKLKHEKSLRMLPIRWQAVLNLLGEADNPSRLVGAVCDEEKVGQLYLEVNDINSLCELHLNKLILSYLFQEYSRAAEEAAAVEMYLASIVGTIWVVLFHFYDSLTQLAIFPEAPPSEQERILEKVAANQEKMKMWAEHAPMNFLHKFYLVEAEHARVLGNHSEAREYYDQAIDLAREHDYLNEEALAYELAAKFYLTRGQARLAYHYLRDAHYAYRRWGAMAKVKDLEARYPQFLIQAEAWSRELPTLTTPTTDSSETASNIFDLTSVLKASQAISGEIVLGQLLEKLMKIVIENAGAQQGYLILEEEGRWVIEAEGRVAETEAEAEVMALQPMLVVQSEKLPMAIIHYVARTRENVVLNEATREGIFTQDPYIIQNQPKSILCAPLINQGKLNGILYLENDLTIGAFTPDRLEVLNILSAQAAISIENARLYTRQVQLTQSASRFVPQEFLQFLHKDSIVKVNLGDQVQQNMTILVSDIRSFTTLSETMTPQENFDFVNAYLGRVSPIIRQHHGLIAKYMGDGMMAIFPWRVEDALNAAIAQLGEMARYNTERQQQRQLPIQIGIGVHTGTVMLGTVGEAQRMQLDLFSDAVNVAARLEGLSKLYGVPLIISTEVLQRLVEPDQYQVRFLGKTQVKGRQEMLSVFEVFDGDPAEIITLKLETKTDFEQGLSFYYDWQFVEARAHFEQVLQHYPADKASQFYLKRMADFTEPRLPVDEANASALTEP
jgi:predicted ATPase/class 3 adenylate cyclase/tRNA A-37 threonylcarbamoyl transferase component Bud32